jgi:hypothetical protein
MDHPDLIGIHIQDAELVDPIGGIIEVLGVRPLQIPVK